MWSLPDYLLVLTVHIDMPTSRNPESGLVTANGLIYEK